MKKFVSILITMSLLMSSVISFAEGDETTYQYSDTVTTVSGVEVFKSDSVTNWQGYTFSGGKASLYLTHDAYDGNAAMLIKHSATNTSAAWISNLTTTALKEANIVVGEKYKVVYYQKPVEKATGGTYSGKYKLALNTRYYNNYSAGTSIAYDIETGTTVTNKDTLESKWYRLEYEFTATDANLKEKAGMTVKVDPTDGAILVDEFSMYRLENEEWIPLTYDTTIKNSGFEYDVTTDAVAENPKSVSANANFKEVKLNWTNRIEQAINIYNGDTLVAEIPDAIGVGNTTITGLATGVEYVFTLKGVLNGVESKGVSIRATPIEPKYYDTNKIVAGVEVFQQGNITDWQKNYLWGNESTTGIYLTHDAYEGNAAMLINPTGTYTSGSTYIGVSATNKNINKTSFVEGDTYKIVYYMKPLTLNSDNKYTLSNQMRYYDNYEASTPKVKIYDIESGNLVSDQSSTTNKQLESKWYRMEKEYTAPASGGIKSGSGGVSFMVWLTNGSCLVDSVTMYHKTAEGTWEAIADGTLVRNGGFESGVTLVRGVNPENITVDTSSGEIVLNWTSSVSQSVNIYNGTELITTVEAGTTTATLSLDATLEYTLTLKGVINNIESNGVNVEVNPYEKIYPDTIALVNGIEVFKAGSITNWAKNFQWGNDSSTGVYLTHDAYEGNSAMLIKPSGETTATTYYGINPTNTNLSKTNFAADDEYKVVYYMKPLTLNSNGKYTLSTTTRYYDNYSTYTSKIYDIESGVEVTDSKSLESKWYRLEKEIAAGSVGERNGNYGISFMTWLTNGACLVDSVTMYHKTAEGTWEAIADGTLVKNGGFESDISEVEYLMADSSSDRLYWKTNTTADGYKVYKISDNERTLVVTIEDSAVDFYAVPDGITEGDVYLITSLYGEYETIGTSSEARVLSGGVYENTLSDKKYVKFETDINYSQGENLLAMFAGDTGKGNIVTINSDGIVIGSGRMGINVQEGKYHLKTILDTDKKIASIILTLPDGSEYTNSDWRYLNGATSITSIDIRSDRLTTDAFENVLINTLGASDYPVKLSYADINVDDCEKLPVDTKSISVDLGTPLFDKAVLDEIIYITEGDVKITPLSTEYEHGVYSFNFEENLKPKTKYTLYIVNNDMGLNYAFEFITEPALYAEIIGISKAGTAVSEISELSDGDTVTVTVDYTDLSNKNQSYSVLAAGYTVDGRLVNAQISEVSAGIDTCDFTFDTFADMNEIKFLVWNSTDKMMPLADEYILPFDTFGDKEAYNLVTTFYGDAGTTRGFAWTAVPEYTDMVIQYAEDDVLWSGNNVSEAAVYTEYNSLLYYKADIDGLEPGETYVYRIGDTVDNVWSEFYTFTTEPENITEFSFIGFTDPQSVSWTDGFEYLKYTVDEAMKTSPEAAFMLSLGDLTEDGREESQWYNYFKATKGYAESLPHMAVVGNHETRGDEVTAGKNFSLHFNNPKNALNSLSGLTVDDVENAYSKGLVNNIAETVYSFDYGNVHFAVLNTGSDWSKTDSYAMLEEQKEWLRSDMNASDKQWKILMLHQGLYPAHTSRWGTKDVLSDVIDECGVDLVLAGHDHIVARTYAIDSEGIVTKEHPDYVTKGTGTVYTILGSAGPKRLNTVVNIPDYAAVLNSTSPEFPCYSIFNVTDNELEVVTKQINGKVVDKFIISDQQ